MPRNGALKVFIVAGEESGDALGAGLMAALRRRLGDDVAFGGVGGEAMEREGLRSLFPLEDIAVMGISAVLGRLPTILKRLRHTVKAVLAERPDILVIIDSPDFTHRVAARVRRRAPAIPVVAWVSPSVWAWRPSRARAMAAYVDHLLALLPFEPEVHRRLGGPTCTFVGHPLGQRRAAFTPGEGERSPLGAGPPKLLMLPGSRKGELRRHLNIFGETLKQLRELHASFEAVLPAVARHAAYIRAEVARWPVPVTVVTGEAAKLAAFRSGHAALAASGTVTLELALAGVPMVALYRLDPLARRLRRFVRVWTVLLPNLVLGRPAVREYIDEFARPDVLAHALADLITDTPERRAQIESLAEVASRLTPPGGLDPADLAADIVLRTAGRAAPQPVSTGRSSRAPHSAQEPS